jgi:hypothetical protein
LPRGHDERVPRTPAGEAVQERQVPAANPKVVALAQPWRRLLAFVIDAAILTLATGALWAGCLLRSRTG